MVVSQLLNQGITWCYVYHIALGALRTAQDPQSWLQVRWDHSMSLSISTIEWKEIYNDSFNQ